MQLILIYLSLLINMEEILKNTLERLTTLPIGNAPTVKLEYIDLDWGQLELEVPPVKFPCALIDIRNMSYSDAGDLSQIGIIEIEIRICDRILSNSSAGAPVAQRDSAMRIFRLTESVFKHLHGWQAPSQLHGALTRISASRSKGSNFKEMRMVFRAQLVELAAQRQYTQVSITTPIL